MAIWQFPDRTGLEFFNGETEEINIFDAEDPTSKRLEYAIFLDDKLAITQVSKLYAEVFKLLFEQQPERFYQTDLAERISLVEGEDASKSLRQAVAIAENYFIEGNSSSSEKFIRIKHALQLFGLEDELSLKYAT